METEISKSKFKAHALEIFRRIESSGSPVIITDHGRPSLIIQRVCAGRVSHPLERLKGSVLHYDTPFDSVAEEDWEALR
ncbi:Antitoxin Phd_YefM, type II toxin-antitoxin system [Modicisalibacter muralis]|uniref:Antitoxin Phd_YefM, type II toxin-antitoxin system n=1 Tax=Modicisalibacter muralis TaxID=119000 RepID=A0A1G9RLB4_9GAMM|nr:type II toxin-antitoxin system Phd/YefM family antitoxin [Halomonas muralis]SDM24082.1 Antitoxin Phd_YefM, type II toxin-antitoxin system [Halomonas muralis]